VDLLTRDADAPTLGNGHDFIVKWVTHIGEAFVCSGRWGIELEVVLIDKVFKLILLLQEGLGGWFGGRLLER
jgi:hypothetical protein